MRWVVCIIMMSLIGSIHSTSLWSSDGDLFSAHKAKHIGDVLTILVEEESSATHLASTDAKNDSQASMSAGQGLLKFMPLSSISSKTDWKGEGNTSRYGKLKAKIQATIAKVLPNGNFFIEGKRTIRVNNDNVEILISGTIRGDDINSDNSVYSSYISDASIRYKGNGSISGQLQKPGVISKLFHILF